MAANLQSKHGLDFVSLNNKKKIMSVAEMKLAAINQITNLEDENAVKEILEHLAKLKSVAKEKFDADSFFNKSVDKYDDVLRKLAQ